ncbi:MAG: hypothetical protein JO254_04305 [Pseudolabrys sp.]|nr:hypothetical protein [Pseudolabrys sp.]
MATRTRRTIVRALPAGSYLEWSPIIAGAIGAAAISFLLLTFGASIGLTLTSPWPNSGMTVWAAVIAVGWWSIMVQIGSFFVGGYLAGRMRAGWGDADIDESRFRDGAHGFMVWALGIIVGAAILALSGGAALKTAAMSGSTVAAGAASGNANALSTSPVDYAVDNLLRPVPRSGGATLSTPFPGSPAQSQSNNPALRDEARRIFTASIKNGELTAADRDYLTDSVATRTGLPQADAQKRVDQSVTQVRDLEVKSRAAADKARKAGIVGGFLTAATLLIGLAAAAAGAALGGRHRDEGTTAHLFGHRFW